MSTKQELMASNRSQDAALAWLLIITMAPHRRPLFVALVLLLATSAMNVLPPYLLQQAIDGPIAQGDVAGLWPLAVLYGATALAMFGLNYAYTYFLQQAAQRALADLRARLFGHMLGQGHSFFTSTPVGDLV